MSGGSSAPDPYATAAAQTQSNQQTAAYNAALNRTSQYTPYGNSVYSQTGTDSTGAPTWSNTISLAPEAQGQLDNQLKQNDQLSQLGFTLADQAKTQINTPYSDQSQSGDAAAKAYYQHETQFLDPQWQQSDSNLASKLANQGVMQGSTAYNRANLNQDNAKQQAYESANNQAITQGQSQQQIALANQSTLKNAPLNALNAVRSGTQIQNPSFTTAPTATAAGTDISGDIYKSSQINADSKNALMNGLFSLAGTAAMASDRRVKRDIKRIGETPVMRLPLYAFRYIWDDVLRVGVMAQDVLKVKPEAVDRSGSIMLVDYSALS